MDGPALAVVFASTWVDLFLHGINLQAGDSAFWVPTSASTCDYVGRDLISISDTGTAFMGHFFFEEIGSWQLCYRFNYLEASGSTFVSGPTDYLLFPDVRVATVGQMSATPTGTGVGCVSNVTIMGRGFAAARDTVVQCNYAGYGSTNATVASDTAIFCDAPAAGESDSTSLHLRFGLELHPPPLLVLRKFTIFGAEDIFVDSALPESTSYDLAKTITLTGTLYDLGAPRCRFGDYSSIAVSDAAVSSGGIEARNVWCEKPAFPGSEKRNLGALPISFAPVRAELPNPGTAFSPAAHT